MTLWLFYKTLLHQKVWNINSCFHWLHQGSQAGLPNPWIAVFINTVQTGRLDQIFTWAHSGQLALMGRHIVISFNCQFVKASYSFQRVSPREEEVEAKESIFQHEPDMGEALTGLVPPGNISLTLRQSQPISNRQRQICCRTLGSPWWAQASWDRTATRHLVFALGGECSSKGCGADLLPLHTWEHPSTLAAEGRGLPIEMP